MNFGSRSAIFAAVMIASLATAKAAIVTDHISVTLAPSAFTVNSGSPPVGNVSISFDLTFDPTAVTTDQTTGFSKLSYNFALGSALSYDVTSPTAPILPNTLIVGGLNEGADTVGFNTNDFYLHITDIAGTPTFQQFGLTTADGSYYFTPVDKDSGASTATGVELTATPVTSVSSVPLPASLPLFGVALFGMAGFRLLGRCRRNPASQPLAG